MDYLAGNVQLVIAIFGVKENSLPMQYRNVPKYTK